MFECEGNITTFTVKTQIQHAVENRTVKWCCSGRRVDLPVIKVSNSNETFTWLVSESISDDEVDQAIDETCPDGRSSSVQFKQSQRI